jgi:transposase
MFVRKLLNRSGSVSVQAIQKKNGSYLVVKTFGSSKNQHEIEQFLFEARSFVKNPTGSSLLFPDLSSEDRGIQQFFNTLTNDSIRTIGPELIFGTIFDRIGFNVIQNELFRHLVIARLAYPTSKLKTVDYLYRYQGIHTHEDTIYRFLDTLNIKYKETVEKISYEHTKKTLRHISVVFYDMTTLYFETEDEDDLRKIGFSKDGKFQCPQIMIGLLVGEGGYPIGYDVFEGNTFEGKTLVPILQKIQKKYGFEKPVVVTDAAMLSKKTLEGLIEEKYTFIIGARIKNETDMIKKEILSMRSSMKDKDVRTLKREDGTTLVVSLSDKRARKDAHNREKGLKKLRAKVKSGVLTKTAITNRGYNKFLSLSQDVSVTIDEVKIKDDEKWDGLKGYVTNTNLKPEKVLEHYSHLWQIEKAFRISKTDLRIRPIYHYKKRRIEAHLCISFVAYSIWKELERLLAEKKIAMSPKRAGELTHTMYELHYILPNSKRLEKKILKMDTEQQTLYEVIHKS